RGTRTPAAHRKRRRDPNRRGALGALPERGAAGDVRVVDHVAVALDVPALAADREQHRFLVERVRDLARGGRLDVEEAALAEDALLALHLDLDSAAMDEVELVLRVVEVEEAHVPGRHHDSVDPESRDAERGAD